MVKSLFIKNPDIINRRVIIYGTDTKALLLFSVLLQNEVYVEAFADPENGNKDIKLMNKPIRNLEDLEGEKGSIVLAVSGLEKSGEAEKLAQSGFEVFYDFNEAAYSGDSILL